MRTAAKTASAQKQDKALASSKNPLWSLKPPKDVRNLVSKAISDMGRDKAFWIYEALRHGLKKYATKATSPSEVIHTLNGK